MITIYSLILLGDKKKIGWTITVVNQAFWLIWIVAAEMWGMIPMNLALSITSIRNYRKWKNEALDFNGKR
jgi:hypothetical protein